MSDIVLSQWMSRTCCRPHRSSISCSSRPISSGVSSWYLSARSVSPFKIDRSSQLVGMFVFYVFMCVRFFLFA